jgi:tRNA uridine 5-carboxymethylaminomethyl modification enzyme
LGSNRGATEVLVIGGGHAGIEAALAASRIGCSVLLVTLSARRIGAMSCNPAIGGIAKGTLVREIEALGGSMGRVADLTRLQFRMLNTRKGPAVWGPRVQSDAADYARMQGEELRGQGIPILEDEVMALEGPTEKIGGVICRRTGRIECRSVVLAMGTFLDGRLFRGTETWRGGRSGDIASRRFEEDLRRRMFHVERFKTGTPPRIARGTVDESALPLQESGSNAFRFAFGDGGVSHRAESFHQTSTNERTRDAVRRHLCKSPLLTGRIGGKGPRYCPSFEDKVVRFPDRTSHNIYVEPMGFASRRLYLNGLSTSLPREAQVEMVRSLPGFGKARISEFGYAVEYTCLHFTEFTPSLRLRKSTNLFVAGQICGTSGYEEAAALGLLAGANAARTVKGLERQHPDAMESYLGVMVQDITSGGSTEPYRLFSSRAENRLHIRQDNAERRLLPLAKIGGLLGGERLAAAEWREEQADLARKILCDGSIGGIPARVLCRRPEVTVEHLVEALPGLSGMDRPTLESVILDERYEGYIHRGMRRMEARRRAGEVSLAGIDSYLGMEELCWEAREVLEKARPRTVAEAERVPGVRPSDVEGLLLHLASGRSTWNTRAGVAGSVE